MRFGANAGDHGDKPARHIADTDGQHHDGKRRLAQNRADHRTLQQHAKNGHGQDRTQYRQPERKAQHRHARQPAKRAQHHELALGKADGFGRLVNQHKSQGDEAVNAPLRNAADQQL